jgi:hypothetical protein
MLEAAEGRVAAAIAIAIAAALATFHYRYTVALHENETWWSTRDVWQRETSLEYGALAIAGSHGHGSRAVTVFFAYRAEHVLQLLQAEHPRQVVERGALQVAL